MTLLQFVCLGAGTALSSMAISRVFHMRHAAEEARDNAERHLQALEAAWSRPGVAITRPKPAPGDLSRDPIFQDTERLIARIDTELTTGSTP